MKKFIYAGKEYTWLELLDMLIVLDNLGQKKEKWWRRKKINKLSYAKGLVEGICFGEKIALNILKKEDNGYMINPQSDESKEKAEWHYHKYISLSSQET